MISGVGISVSEAPDGSWGTQKCPGSVPIPFIWSSKHSERIKFSKKNHSQISHKQNIACCSPFQKMPQTLTSDQKFDRMVWCDDHNLPGPSRDGSELHLEKKIKVVAPLVAEIIV